MGVRGQGTRCTACRLHEALAEATSVRGFRRRLSCSGEGANDAFNGAMPSSLCICLGVRALAAISGKLLRIARVEQAMIVVIAFSTLRDAKPKLGKL